MIIELDPGREITLRRSINGKILIVIKDGLATLVETNDGQVRVEVLHTDDDRWQCPTVQNLPRFKWEEFPKKD